MAGTSITRSYSYPWSFKFPLLLSEERQGLNHRERVKPSLTEKIVSSFAEAMGRTRIVPIRIRGSVIRIQVPRRTVGVIRPTAEKRLDPTCCPLFQPKCPASGKPVLMLDLSRALWILYFSLFIVSLRYIKG